MSRSGSARTRLGFVVGLVVVLVGVFAVAAFGKAAPAPQPFALGFDGTVKETGELAGNRVDGQVSGSIQSGGFSGAATASYVKYSLQRLLVSSYATGDSGAKLEIRAEIAPELLLAIKCSIRSNPVGKDLGIVGSCVVSTSDKSVHGSGKLAGTLDSKPGGVLSFTLDGKGSCKNLDPKLCPLG